MHKDLCEFILDFSFKSPMLIVTAVRARTIARHHGLSPRRLLFNTYYPVTSQFNSHHYLYTPISTAILLCTYYLTTYSHTTILKLPISDRATVDTEVSTTPRLKLFIGIVFRRWDSGFSIVATYTLFPIWADNLSTETKILGTHMLLLVWSHYVFLEVGNYEEPQPPTLASIVFVLYTISDQLYLILIQASSGTFLSRSITSRSLTTARRV